MDFLIEYDNAGTIQQDNVVIKSELHNGFECISGSTVLYNAFHPTASGGLKVIDGIVSDNGINIGSYTAGSNALIKFSATVTSTDPILLGNRTHVITTNGSRSVVLQFDALAVPEQLEPDEPLTPIKFNLGTQLTLCVLLILVTLLLFVFVIFLKRLKPGLYQTLC